MESEGNIQINIKKNKKPHSKKALKHKKRKFSTQNVNKCQNNEDSSSDAFISNTDYTLDNSNAVCACCYEWDNEMYKCYLCNRKYHKECHIPIITHRNENQTKWQCTLCEDITAISKDLGKDHDIDNICIGTVGRKIVERILMELLCRFTDIDHFRNSPNKYIFRENWEYNTERKELNNIKNLLGKNNHYISLDKFLEDTKQIFVNAMSYYNIGDPCFKSANKLLKFLRSLYNKWIMSTSKKVWKNRKQMAVRNIKQRS